MEAWPLAPQGDFASVSAYLVGVGLYVREVERIHSDLTACPNIVWIPRAPSPTPASSP